MGFGKEMGGCASLMKYSLFFSNFVILIGGLVVLAIGVWTLIAKSFVTDLLGTNLFMGAVYILIGTGVVVSLIAFFGCLGAVKEIKCMLLMYFIIVFVIFVTLLVGGILGYVFKDKVQITMEQEMRSSIRYYGQRRHITKAWDDTQMNLRCCGVYRFTDWQGSIPNSCCRAPIDGRSSFYQEQSCNANANYPANIYQNGCLNTTTYFIRDHATIIGGAGIGVACLMLLGMIFSCALFLNIE